MHLELIDGPEGLAGSEQTRTTLWGTALTREYGAKFLPRLVHGDLWVSNAELDEFEEECKLLLRHVIQLARSTSWRVDYIGRRLQNLIGAAALARKVGGGLLVD